MLSGALSRKMILVFACLLSPLWASAAKISLHIKGQADKQPPILYLPCGKEFPIAIDPEGRGTLELDISEPTYADLGYHYSRRVLFLLPDTDLRISFVSDRYKDRADFAGAGSEVNNYLNDGRLKALTINDAELEETACLAKLDSLLSNNMSVLSRAGLPDVFVQMERERLKYFTSATLPGYPYYHRRIAKDSAYRPSSEYWGRMDELMIPDASLMRYGEYRAFISEAAPRVASHRYPDLKYPYSLIKYVASDVPESRIAEHLIYECVYSHVQKRGLDEHAEDLGKVFRDYVRTPDLIKNFESLCSSLREILPGALSPDFSCTDPEGNKVTLSDFKGRYVYIDVWATWCGPCHREMPYLRAMQERYAGKDIYIVSISCDADRKAWETAVKKRMTGIQLRFDDEDTFMEKYMIRGVPRFILLDQEGKIISSDMSRPSDGKTVETLDNLLNASAEK